MDENFLMKGRSRRKTHHVTNLHHYKVELFYATIDSQLQELNNLFSEANIELLICVTCLNPNDLFASFDKEKLIHFSQFYPQDFSATDLVILDNQLETYILDMRSAKEFSSLNGNGSLTVKLVQTKRSIIYLLVYLLVKLALTLPVTTVSVEIAFSAMKIVKNRLWNRMGDQFLNDCLISYIEKDVFDKLDNETVLQRFQKMKKCRGQLCK